MNFKLSGHHLDITPPLREYVETKLERVIRHFDQVIGVSVLLSVDNHKEKNRRQYAEINLHLKGKDVFVESHHEDLYAAIDLTVRQYQRAEGVFDLPDQVVVKNVTVRVTEGQSVRAVQTLRL